jgi:hypothetical protein
MAKPNHAKRSRPRPMSSRKLRSSSLRAADRRTQRELERWRRS